MKKLILSIAASACCISVWSQNHSKNECLAADAADSEHLHGTWQARFADARLDAVLQLGPHTEWQGTVQGTAQRGSHSLLVVGDMDQGQLTLEESTDGRRISATWLGQADTSDCHLRIQGEWRQDEAPPVAFTLQRLDAPAHAPTPSTPSGW
jgi:hypothetical protein